MISESRVEKALTYLADTDEQEAELYAESQRAEIRWKETKQAVFLSFDHGSVAEKEARAANSQEAQEALREYLQAVEDHRGIWNKRKKEALVIDVWRSLNANRRQGS